MNNVGIGMFVLIVMTPYLLSFHVTKSETLNDTKTLMNQLFKINDYVKTIRPIEDQQQVVDVFIAFYLNAITNFNEQVGSLTTAGFLSLHWIDHSLTWEPADYNDTFVLIIPQNDIWKPDISLRNSYENFGGLGNPFFNVWVYYNGSVIWEPFQVLTSTCKVDITYFPYDTQSCDLLFIAWSYLDYQIKIYTAPEIITVFYSESSTWKLVNSSATFLNSFQASVTYNLKLQRKPTFYVLNIILPVMLLSLLNIVTFILPIKAGERASYSVTVFLSLAVFLTIVASETPRNSDKLSLLSVYLILMISMSTVYVVVSVTEMRIGDRDGNKLVSESYKKLFHCIQALQFKRNCCRKRRVSDAKTNIGQKNEDKVLDEVTWIDVVNAMDFILFCFGIIVNILCTAILMVLMLCNSDG